MNIYEKLKTVQNKLKVPKDATCKFGTSIKYKYRSAETILEKVKPILDEVNAVIVMQDDFIEIGSNTYLKSSATFIDCESGEKLSAYGFAKENTAMIGKMDTSQIIGSASSYGRKYALCGLLLIDDNKDVDTTEYQTSLELDKMKKEITSHLRKQNMDNQQILKTVQGVIAQVVNKKCTFTELSYNDAIKVKNAIMKG